MAKPRSQAPRSPRGTAAGGGNPGTNTSAADQAARADVSESAGASAPANPPVSEGSPPLSETGNTPPEGGHAESAGAPAGTDILGVEDFAVEGGVGIPASGILSIRACRPEGMRRAGRYWSGTVTTEVPVSDFTDEQLERLLTEPLLKVTIILDTLEDAP